MDRRRFLSTALLAAGVGALRTDDELEASMMQRPEEPFDPTWESLERFECPEWFRDAKLGIWSHWGPQAVPMAGDWYARNMYQQGHRQYQHHLENYGHPSQHGYKDIIPLWKAEKWDPDRLMALYKRAGARYFVSMGVHHDNFDLWDSRHNEWNAVRMGPKRDVVGDWQKAARKLGLRFGVSEHLGASFTWFQTSRGSDKEGPMAGVPYDGADAKYESLYHWPAAPDDREWYTRDPRWHQHWLERITDLVDRYRPDLLYTDGGIPFDSYGRRLVAHFYNLGARPGGGTDSVYTCKQDSQGRWVQDLERGVMAGVRDEPWQTDTSIGDWYYNRDWKYRGADWVIHMLVDIVSKNGNLLLNVVQRPDGSLDPEAEQVLEEMADWIAVNGEAIYGTRPWALHGEGPTRARGGHFAEDYAYGARDIRFTTKGDTLYAAALGWPEDGKLTIRTLAAKAPGVRGEVKGVRLLGSKADLRWERGPEGLVVTLPQQKPCRHAYVLEITGLDVPGSKPVEPPREPLRAAADGTLVLKAADADLQGSLRVQGGSEENIGYWDNPRDTASWPVHFDAPGSYRVSARVATAAGATAFLVDSGSGEPLRVEAPRTGDWNAFREIDCGTLKVDKAGEQTLTIRPADAAAWKPMNLSVLKLKPKAGE